MNSVACVYNAINDPDQEQKRRVSAPTAQIKKTHSQIPKPSAKSTTVLQEITQSSDPRPDAKTTEESPQEKQCNEGGGKAKAVSGDGTVTDTTPQAATSAAECNENHPPKATKASSSSLSRPQNGPRRGRGWFRGRRGRGVRVVTAARHDEAKNM
jgi:hypothetical protein